MRTEREAIADVERRADYLKQETGRRSWAAVIQDSHQFLCSHCRKPFDPDEVQTAHHFARRCVGMDGSVPAYRAGDACPVRLPEPAL